MADMPEYEIYAIRYATQESRPASATFVGGSPDEETGGLDYFTWAIKGPDRSYVVDTGFTRATAAHYERTFLMEPAEGLRRIGIDPAEVEDVILTHAHFDHVGNLADFPKARFHMQDLEMTSITGRDMTHPLFKVAYHKEDTLALVSLVYDGRMTFWDGDGAFAPGIEFRFVGGHSRGQMALRVWTKRGWVVLASDAVHLYEEIETDRPFFIFYDLKEMLEGYRALRHMAPSLAHVVPGHDPRVTRRYPAASPDLEGLVVRLDLEPSV